MQQRKEVTAVSVRPAEMSFCGDAEIKAKGRNSAAFSHTRIRKGMLSRIRQARRRLTAFKINIKQEILTESP